MFPHPWHRCRVPLLSLVLALVAAIFATVSVVPAHADEGVILEASREGLSLDPTFGLGLKPHLFTLLDLKTNTRVQSYCVEINTALERYAELVIADWNSYPGDNQFAKSSEVRARVAWIATHSYPRVTLGELSAASGVAYLSVPVAITATQAAIWHFTDGFELDARRLPKSVPQLYQYLLGAANTGATSTKLTLSTSFDPQLRDGKVGPLRFDSSASSVKVSRLPLPLLDRAGNVINADQVPTNQDLYFQVAPGVDEGEAEVIATVDGNELVGQLLVPMNSRERSQTLMIVDAKEYKTSVKVSVKWPAIPPAPTPTPTPTPDAPPPTPARRPRALPATGVESGWLNTSGVGGLSGIGGILNISKDVSLDG